MKRPLLIAAGLAALLGVTEPTKAQEAQEDLPAISFSFDESTGRHVEWAFWGYVGGRAVQYSGQWLFATLSSNDRYDGDFWQFWQNDGLNPYRSWAWTNAAGGVKEIGDLLLKENGIINGGDMLVNLVGSTAALGAELVVRHVMGESNYSLTSKYGFTPIINDPKLGYGFVISFPTN